MVRQLLRAARLLTPERMLSPAWLEIDDGVITALGTGQPPRAPDRDFGSGDVVIPGMVDMHTHGGGGHDLAGPDAAGIRGALAWSVRRGVTSSVLSTVSAPTGDLVETIALAADLRREQAAGPPAVGLSPRTRLVGVHLEGPFLSSARRGAHPESELRPPRPAELARLLGTEPGTVVMVTLAPELDGALAAIGAIRDAGAVVAVGHTDADFAGTAAAIRAGARVATHLFNGMPALHHRAPGPAGALLAAAEVTCELINDGTHLHPAVAAIAARAAGRGRVALITDAQAATGAPDGRYRLGRLTVERSGGAVHLVDEGAPRGDRSVHRGAGVLAGGAAGLDEALRRFVQVVGIPLVDAVAAVTSTPAAALGVADRAGAIAVGRPGDLCVLDAELTVRAVCVGGRWLDPVAAPRQPA